MSGSSITAFAESVTGQHAGSARQAARRLTLCSLR